METHSALYVVDLVRFRQLAAGDRLRAQYQQLSADPNSLANLDQDLPNNMQHIVPIYSLPQEWLWCETWCSDESLKKAKTIDLVSIKNFIKRNSILIASSIVQQSFDKGTKIRSCSSSGARMGNV